ncbi:16S rRNA (guanine(966)-N(2))-methyltransferase RsmD [Aliishimia ponticola]|uniref:16S rRNA (Guanine(966)-N(2))-methyltransferase RsmD n=1 Tax=Aliishimia ponticola TaxID=2499833 RepID=A0A4S4NC69_9RHOB|nr:16S rRNA (guanine(966)-N(2))-methyltransferase RsmD [Aliishimia ponticola]THH37014.1 16S rRNA (guanine(966)-N(2))-methyltransferase RsmD [Aliishimia ponticola]
MRIIAGRYRGTPLASVGKGDAAAHLRPTPDRVRESLFSILGGLVDWDGLHVLDLFAGTGALGLEAISRGAAQAVFVENGRVGQKLIAQNIAKLRVGEAARLLKMDATRLGPAPEPVDLVFLDPPYGKGLGTPALTAARDGGWLAESCVIVWEENAPQEAPPGFELLSHRKYGDTHLTFLAAQSAT